MEFKFNPRKNLFVGVKRECFLLDSKGNLAPFASKVSNEMNLHSKQHVHRLSEYQMEWWVGPCKSLSKFSEELEISEIAFKYVQRKLGFSRSFNGVNNGVINTIPRISTYIHIWMPSTVIALRAYNRAIKNFGMLYDKKSKPVRKRISLAEFSERVIRTGFNADPLDSLTWIQISTKGTLQFWIPNLIDNFEKVMQKLVLCYNICK